MQTSPADDKATFLAEFCALRDRARIDYDELAARTHFPPELLKSAENGPGLPGLPVLAAYVRACGGDATEWEERWRRLGGADGNDAELPTRHAGASPAARAGARAGVSVAPAEMHDAERIRKALRAHRGRGETSTGQTGWPGGDSPASGGNGSGGNGSGGASSAGLADPGPGGRNESWDAGTVLTTELPAPGARPARGAATEPLLAASQRSALASAAYTASSQAPGTRDGARQAPSHAVGPGAAAAAAAGRARQIKLMTLAVVLVIIVCVVALMLT